MSNYNDVVGKDKKVFQISLDVALEQSEDVGALYCDLIEHINNYDNRKVVSTFHTGENITENYKHMFN